MRFPDGRDSTVSLQNLAPCPRSLTESNETEMNFFRTSDSVFVTVDSNVDVRGPVNDNRCGDKSLTERNLTTKPEGVALFPQVYVGHLGPTRAYHQADTASRFLFSRGGSHEISCVK